MNKKINEIIVMSDTGKGSVTLINRKNGNFIRNIYVSANSGPHGITVCENGQFLCFSNQYDNSINIYDMEKEHLGESIGTGATPCHIAQADGKLYVTNFDSDSISVVDLEEENGMMVISSGIMPHDILEWQRLIITAESGSDSIGIIDSSTDEYSHRIELKCSPIHICRIPGKNIIAAACTQYGIEVKGYICILDLDSLKLADRIRVGNCITDIAADSDGRHVYVTDGGKGSVYKVDMDTGLVVADIYLSGFLTSISFDDENKKLLVTEGIKNHMYIIDCMSGIVERVISSGTDISHTVFM